MVDLRGGGGVGGEVVRDSVRSAGVVEGMMGVEVEGGLDVVVDGEG